MHKKWRSRPISRVLSWTVIPLGPASTSASSVQPGCGTSRAIAPLLGLAPGGVCRAPRRWPRGRWALTPPFHPCHAPSRAVRRSVLCCTFRRLTPPRRYLAPCSMEPGLSSAHCCDATVWPTPPRRLSHGDPFGGAQSGRGSERPAAPRLPLPRPDYAPPDCSSPPYNAFLGAPLSSAASFAATDGFRCADSSA